MKTNKSLDNNQNCSYYVITNTVIAIHRKLLENFIL